MNCEQVQNLLGQFHDGELETAARLDVEIHLGNCRACAAELGAIAELAEAARTLSEPEPPANLWDRLAGRLTDHEPVSRTSPWSILRSWRGATVAALVLVLLATGWMIFER